MSLVSIIVPVYNNGTTLDSCIQSIMHQSYKKIEIILIDDGSVDDSGSKCDAYAKSDKRIKVVHQKNNGVSFSRNFGTAISLGKYIFYCDADDVISSDCIEKLYSNAEKDNADIVYGLLKLASCTEKNVFDFSDFGETTVEEDRRLMLKKHLLDLSQAIFRENNGYVSRGPVARLVKKRIAVETPFDVEIKIGEDILWNLDILKKAHVVKVAKFHCYNYVVHEESKTHRFNKEIGKEIIAHLDTLYPYVVSNDEMTHYFNHMWELMRMVCDNYYVNERYDKSIFKATLEFNKNVRAIAGIDKIPFELIKGYKGKIKYIILESRLMVPYAFFLKNMKMLEKVCRRK